MADADRMREVADHVKRTIKHGTDVVLVVSAMGKETDDLLKLAAEVSDIRPGREMDMLITAGERKATALMSMALFDIGVPAESFTGSQAGFLTDTTHTNARILEIRPDRVRESLAAGRVPVIGGSQGMSTERDVTFLGRGGSDTTAVAIAAALGADSCELYTDVSGVFNADPRLVPGARRVDKISFEALLEMTATGCPKPAMRSVEFARNHGVTLHVRSAFTWEPGTWVVEEDPTMEHALVTAITHDTSEAKITLANAPDEPGVAATVFRRLAERDVNVDMIVQNVSAQGHTAISFTAPHRQVDICLEIMPALSEQLGSGEVTVDQHIGRVSLVGAGMQSNPGVAARMFEVLAEAGINIEMISTSAIRVSCVVREDRVEDAVQALHAAFELDKPLV